MLFINNWSYRLATPLASSALTLSLEQAAIDRLAGLDGGEHYLLTLVATNTVGFETDWEIVKVTAAATGSLTVERGQQGTSALDWAADTLIECRLTAGTLAELAGRMTPPGGTSGQVLAKNSGADGDAGWIDPPAGGGAVMLPFPVINDASLELALGLDHASTYHRVTAEPAATRTVPPQSSVAWPDNTEIQIEQAGAGAVTIAGGAGVTINRLAGTNAVIAGQYAVVALKRVAADVWTLIGALELTA